MKVVFLYHYYERRVEFPPLGMLYICAIFEKMGFEVEVLYFNKDTPSECFPEAYIYAYSISAIAIYSEFKEILPKVKNKAEIFIAGNTHASIFPEYVINELGVDVVFCGESEIQVREWIEQGCKGRGIISTRRALNIDFPYPARHLLPKEKIYMQNRIGGKSKASISMISSRGCVYGCKFCAIQNRGKVVFRSIDNFRNEVGEILREYSECDGITLLDETFTMNEQFAINIAEIFREFNLKWECNTRVDKLNRKIISTLSKSNCMEVRLGIESGAQEILNAMGKGITIQRIEQTLKMLSDFCLGVKMYIMHGYPGENMASTMETVKFLERNQALFDRISLYQFTPLPGSPIYQELAAANSYNWDDFTIYNNERQWWGSKEEYREIKKAYNILKETVEFLNTKKR